jgi:hypothetical protein
LFWLAKRRFDADSWLYARLALLEREAFAVVFDDFGSNFCCNRRNCIRGLFDKLLDLFDFDFDFRLNWVQLLLRRLFSRLRHVFLPIAHQTMHFLSDSITILCSSPLLGLCLLL